MTGIKQVGAVLLWVAIALLVVVIATIVAQGQTPAAPTLDASTTELMASWLREERALAKTVQARIDAMVKTPEGQAYQAALAERQKTQQEIQKKIGEKVPGYAVDFATGKLVPKPAAQAK